MILNWIGVVISNITEKRHYNCSKMLYGCYLSTILMIFNWKKNVVDLTVSKQHENGQIHSSFPAGIFLDGDAIAGGGKHFAAPDGDQLAALVSARHIVQHCSIVDEGVQFAAGRDRRTTCRKNTSSLFTSSK